VGQVCLARDFPVIGCEFFKQRPFPAYAVEIKELLGTSITIPEPGYCSELMVPSYLFLQGVGHVVLCFQEDAPDCFILRVTLKLYFCQVDFLL
jgi:hypothetical protein